VTIALSLTIRPQFAMAYLQFSNQLGRVTLYGAKFGEELRKGLTDVSQFNKADVSERNRVDVA